jgi:diaminohydroxyphosphoribosylaminopyrimidine deaminase/5-amino-6-(5-phosphoribosylamino)uracil reductase
MFKAADHEYMALALQLAERGLYTTTPNPRVGCVIVKHGAVVGLGWHERAGLPHAEVHALQQAGSAAQGATAYVTLEPCSHVGRTPPCADALIRAGVARVVAAMQDPNPKVSGQGLAKLQAAGIATASGLMQGLAHDLNIGFISRMERGRPWVRLKAAASLDGRTALANGASQWITSEPARNDVQRWRARACAVLTGVGTVLHDDPQLNVRNLEIGRQPLRVVVDSQLRTPPGARIARPGTLVVCAGMDSSRVLPLQRSGVEVMALPDAHGQVDIARLLQELAARQINELHVEAGAKLNGALVKQGLADELLLYLAPKLMGNAARGLFDLPSLTGMDQAIALDIRDMVQIGPDIRIQARILC